MVVKMIPRRPGHSTSIWRSSGRYKMVRGHFSHTGIRETACSESGIYVSTGNVIPTRGKAMIAQSSTPTPLNAKRPTKAHSILHLPPRPDAGQSRVVHQHPLQQLARFLRVCLAVGRLHHLANEETEQRSLPGAVPAAVGPSTHRSQIRLIISPPAPTQGGRGTMGED